MIQISLQPFQDYIRLSLLLNDIFIRHSFKTCEYLPLQEGNLKEGRAPLDCSYQKNFSDTSCRG